MHDMIIGNYRVTGTLGEGGMGTIYAAEHTLLGRPAAIKILKPEYTRNREIVERFFNEARAATTIRHPGIVEIYDFGHQQDGSAYIAMELLEGEELEVRLRRMGRLPVEMAVQFALQVASALRVAHDSGIVHRDLKPANIFIVADPQVVGGERVKLLDFGIAKVAAADAAGGGDATTRAGSVMGTPAYMSPEQCTSAGEVDGRTDLYAFGCILFEMLCGQLPFAGVSSMELIAAHMRRPPPVASEIEPRVPRELDLVIVRLMAKDPAERYQSAADLEQALLIIAGKATGNITMPGARRARRNARLRSSGLVAALLVIMGAVGVTVGVMRKQGATDSAPAERAQPAAAVPAPAPPPPVPPPVRFIPLEQLPEPLEAGTVKWIIRSRPSKAQVFHGKELAGETPIAALVAADETRRENLELRLYGHVDTRLELSAAADTDETVELQPFVEIKVFSRPAGAIIYQQESGEAFGKTPGLIGVAPGAEPIHFVLRLEGYADHVLEVIPTRDKDKSIRLTMKKLVILRIESEPAGAEVRRDGRSLGKTPYDDALPQGSETLTYELTLDGYQPGAVTLRPKRNSSKRVVLRPATVEENDPQ